MEEGKAEMKTLIIIAGVIAISGTDALAANLKPIDDGGNALSQSSLSSSLPTQLSTTEAGNSNHQVTQESQLNFSNLRGNVQLIIADFVSSDRGDPDNRDRDAQGGGTR